MIGTMLGTYRIDSELGAGGMGTVYRGTGADGVVVALKVIHPHLVADADALVRFRREAAVGISIRHPNVVATLAAGEADGQHWLALEYVEGQTLHSLQEELGKVPEELCRHVAHEIAMGLAAIHAAGIVHRDMKPENVLITRDHVVKVMDLGVARGAEDDARVTQTGAFVGSLQYAAPEQFKGGGKGLDGRADLHALGVVLYELSTGANPYEDTDWRVVFQRVLKDVPRRLGAVNPQVSPFFEEVVHTLLAKDRDARFASAAELATVLEAGEDSPWWSSKARSIRGATKRPLRRIKIPRETALVGRDVEMAKLRAAFEKTKAGDGQVVLVEGEAGIGKSRLVDEFVALLQREGEDLDFLYGSYPPGGAATASGAFTKAYREHFGSEGLAATLCGYLKETPLLVPGFAALLTNQSPPEGALALTKDSLQTCFVHATRAIAAERIAVVLIDDLHFAPEEGKALFASLAMAVPGHRILLVGTSRPPIDEKWASNIVRIGHTTRVGVGRLGARDLVALLKDALKSAHLAEELAAKIAEKTDGNPFFVFEVLRGLRDGQYLTQKPDGTWATTRVIHEIQIPSSIADMVQARVSDLGDDDRNLLEVAACVGFEFDPTLVGAVLGLAAIPTLQRFGAIEKRTRLVRASGKRFIFDHHQVQEHLYAGISEALREQYHGAVGDALEARSGAAGDPSSADGTIAASICRHLQKAGRGAAALRWLEGALRHLSAGYMHAAAAELLGAALESPTLLVGRERACRLRGLAACLAFLAREPERRAVLVEAASIADSTGDASLRVSVRLDLADSLVRTGRTTDAEGLLIETRGIAQDTGDRRAEGTTQQVLGAVYLALGRIADGVQANERALENLRSCGDVAGEAGVAGNLGTALFRAGRRAEAEQALVRSLESFRALGNVRGQAVALAALAWLYADSARLGDAVTNGERALAMFRQVGDRWAAAGALGDLGSCLVTAGRHDEARACKQRSLECFREIGGRRGEAIALLGLGSLATSRGRMAEAVEGHASAIEIFREIHDSQSLAMGLENLGSARSVLGDFDTARTLLSESRALSSRVGDLRNVGWTSKSLGDTAARAGDVATARREWDAAEEAWRLCEYEVGVAMLAVPRAVLDAEGGNRNAACVALPGAIAIARSAGLGDDVTRATAYLAWIGAPPSSDAVAEIERSLEAAEYLPSMETRLVLWRATGQMGHLVEAKRLLDYLVENAPLACRESMVVNVRLHREIAEAAKAAGL